MRPSDGDIILRDLRVLVLEDEGMVALLLGDMLRDLGCDVIGPASHAAEAMGLLTRSPQVALVDVNLRGGESGYGVAAALAARRIPFAFVTGHGAHALRPEFRDRPTLQKPFHLAALIKLVGEMAAELA